MEVSKVELDMKDFALAMSEVQPGESVILTPNVGGGTYVSVGLLQAVNLEVDYDDVELMSVGYREPIHRRPVMGRRTFAAEVLERKSWVAVKE